MSRNILSVLIFVPVILVASSASADSYTETHASTCEAVRPANGHKLIHSKWGLENNSTQSIWVSCPVTIDTYPSLADYKIFTEVYNNSNSSVRRADCILRYFDYDQGRLVTESRAANIQPGSTSQGRFDWELNASEIANVSLSCKLLPGIEIWGINSWSREY